MKFYVAFVMPAIFNFLIDAYARVDDERQFEKEEWQAREQFKGSLMTHNGREGEEEKF